MVYCVSHDLIVPSRLFYSHEKTPRDVSNETEMLHTQIVFESEKRLGLLDKAARIRLEAWLRKLHEGTPNPTWKKNRNTYAKLMLEMLRRGRLESPYTTQPPNGPLPMLPQWKGGRTQLPRLARIATTHTVACCTKTCLVRGWALVHEAGSRECTRRRVWEVPTLFQPGASFTTEMMQRSELEAQLGAMRERCAELEWRLSQADAKMAEQNRELAATKEELSRVRDQKDADTRKMRQTHRRDLEDLIGKRFFVDAASSLARIVRGEDVLVNYDSRAILDGCCDHAVPFKIPFYSESSAEDGAEMRMNKPGVLGEDFNLGYTVSGTNVGDDEGRLESHFRNYGVNLDEYDTATPRGKESQKAVSDQDFLSYLDSFQQQ
eukprot:gene10887-12882_t